MYDLKLARSYGLSLFLPLCPLFTALLSGFRPYDVLQL